MYVAYDGEYVKISKLFSIIGIVIIILLLCGIVSCLTPYENHLARGAIALKNGNYDEAIAEYTKLIEVAPNQATGYFWRGTCYYDIHQYDLAIKDLTTAIELRDSSLDLEYNFRGLALFAKGDYDSAISDFSKSIEINPNPLCYNHRGLAYHAKKYYELAIEDFSTAIGIAPRDERLYNNRADTYIEMGQISLAIADLRKTIELSLSYDNPEILQSAEDRLKSLSITE